ncbi:MAG: hypothetical protein NVSMB17_15700 [Candidatus Dormibacteria bacterium]
MGEQGGDVEASDPDWSRFKQERATQLDAWIEAERRLARSRLGGSADLAAGDRLLAAEAALQTAIIDFAASQPGITRPTPLAIGILRRAEAMLAEDRDARADPSGGVRGKENPQGAAPGTPAPGPGRQDP